MRAEIKTFKWTCDGWFYRGGKEYDPVDCPNTLRLTGTWKELELYFEQSGWRQVEHLVAETAIEKHLCPRKHGQSSLNVSQGPHYIDANSVAAQAES